MEMKRPRDEKLKEPEDQTLRGFGDGDPWAKYEEAIEFLREQDGGQGSYFEEVACLMEELLGRLYEATVKPEKVPKGSAYFSQAIGRQLAERHRKWAENGMPVEGQYSNAPPDEPPDTPKTTT